MSTQGLSSTPDNESGISPQIPTTEGTNPQGLIGVIELQQAYQRIRAQFNNSRNLLLTAKAIQDGQTIRPDDPPHFKIIEKRMEQGKPIEDIIAELAAETKDLEGKSLISELKFLEAKASLLRQEVGSPATDEDILRIGEIINRRGEVNLGDPVTLEIISWKNEGQLDEKMSQARKRIELRERTRGIYSAAKARKEGKRNPQLEPEIEQLINQRLENGESLDEIIAKTEANLHNYEQVDRKKAKLAQTLKTIDYVKADLDRLTQESST